ncbi:hypothetical protein [Ferrimonas marina]|uniref:Uncharacterized protein n=1 Tax=Ferrimonas marina TaxID=299255 RepID=A0A1M5ZFN2_9GAMM|nr:hypothetical protein [Ferrimonas marina]SHI22693.1 hypothetical protein SAMN02745129_0171 [Ferrimonas marina]
MNKKLLATLISASILAGCSSSKDNDNDNQGPAVQNATFTFVTEVKRSGDIENPIEDPGLEIENPIVPPPTIENPIELPETENPIEREEFAICAVPGLSLMQHDLDGNLMETALITDENGQITFNQDEDSLVTFALGNDADTNYITVQQSLLQQDAVIELSPELARGLVAADCDNLAEEELELAEGADLFTLVDVTNANVSRSAIAAFANGEERFLDESNAYPGYEIALDSHNEGAFLLSQLDQAGYLDYAIVEHYPVYHDAQEDIKIALPVEYKMADKVLVENIAEHDFYASWFDGTSLRWPNMKHEDHIFVPAELELMVQTRTYFTPNDEFVVKAVNLHADPYSISLPDLSNEYLRYANMLAGTLSLATTLESYTQVMHANYEAYCLEWGYDWNTMKCMKELAPSHVIITDQTVTALPELVIDVAQAPRADTAELVLTSLEIELSTQPQLWYLLEDELDIEFDVTEEQRIEALSADHITMSSDVKIN